MDYKEWLKTHSLETLIWTDDYDNNVMTFAEFIEALSFELANGKRKIEEIAFCYECEAWPLNQVNAKLVVDYCTDNDASVASNLSFESIKGLDKALAEFHKTNKNVRVYR